MRYCLLAAAALLGSCRADDIAQPSGNGENVPTELVVTANSWATRAPMPIAGGVYAAVVNNSLGQPVVYAIGGTTVQAYNYVTNSWTRKASLPLTLTGGSNGVGVIDKKIYLTGAGDRFSDRYLFVYDPATNTWTRKADPPTWSNGGVTGVIAGKLYVLTGYVIEDCADCDGYSTILLRYDPATDTWAHSFFGELARAPESHNDGSGAVINGKFYVAGGRHDGITSNKLHVYDPITNTWAEKAPMPRQRYGAGGAALNGQFYVIGGSNRYGAVLHFVQAYDPAANAWVTKAPLPTARTFLGTARLVINGRQRIVAVGGFNTTALRTNEVYTP